MTPNNNALDDLFGRPVDGNGTHLLSVDVNLNSDTAVTNLGKHPRHCVSSSDSSEENSSLSNTRLTRSQSRSLPNQGTSSTSTSYAALLARATTSDGTQSPSNGASSYSSFFNRQQMPPPASSYKASSSSQSFSGLTAPQQTPEVPPYGVCCVTYAMPLHCRAFACLPLYS